jgi:hypothetical protein
VADSVQDLVVLALRRCGLAHIGRDDAFWTINVYVRVVIDDN